MTASPLVARMNKSLSFSAAQAPRVEARDSTPANGTLRGAARTCSKELHLRHIERVQSIGARFRGTCAMQPDQRVSSDETRRLAESDAS